MNIFGYRIVPTGGRVKTAAVSLKFLYPQELQDYRERPDEKRAQRLHRALISLRGTGNPGHGNYIPPPQELLDACFPQGGEKLLGPGLYKPMLKNDQGPGGNFSEFYISDAPTEARFTGARGYCIKERFASIAFENPELAVGLAALKEAYSSGNFGMAKSLIHRLAKEAATKGVGLVRHSAVGRLPYFFVRRATYNDKPNFNSKDLEKVKKLSGEALGRAVKIARALKARYDGGVKDLKTDNEESRGANENVFAPAYLQSDIIVKKGGDFSVRKVNIPDVGFFLSELGIEGVSEQCAALGREAAEAIDKSFGSGYIEILTGPEVVSGMGDVIETIEIEFLKNELERCGRNVVVSSDLKDGVKNLLLMDRAEISDRILSAAKFDGVVCRPDPFLKLVENEATTLQRIRLEYDSKIGLARSDLGNFFKAVKCDDGKQGERLNRIDEFLKSVGITDEIIYAEVAGQSSPISTIRHSAHGFEEILKRALEKLENGITIYGIPFKPEDAVVFGPDGPRYAEYRFLEVLE